jgi:hypothetical protein
MIVAAQVPAPVAVPVDTPPPQSERRECPVVTGSASSSCWFISADAAVAVASPGVLRVADVSDDGALEIADLSLDGRAALARLPWRTERTELAIRVQREGTALGYRSDDDGGRRAHTVVDAAGKEHGARGAAPTRRVELRTVPSTLVVTRKGTTVDVRLGRRHATIPLWDDDDPVDCAGEDAVCPKKKRDGRTAATCDARGCVLVADDAIGTGRCAGCTATLVVAFEW